LGEQLVEVGSVALEEDLVLGSDFGVFFLDVERACLLLLLPFAISGTGKLFDLWEFAYVGKLQDLGGKLSCKELE